MKSRIGFIVILVLTLSSTLPGFAEAPPAWTLAQANTETFRFATLFTAEDVGYRLSTQEQLDTAVQWCKECGITHVFLETFRGGYLVPLATLQKAKQRFVDEGFLVSGCITTVGLGRKSVNGWIFPCFTEEGGMENLKHIFEYTAMNFDEIMIDDFFATQCQCEDCLKGKGENSWAKFRTDRLVEVSQKYVLEPSRKVNPDVKIIIKYPQWYEDFHNRGYDTDRQTKMYDKTWVGTETRDPDNAEWGRHPQYMAYFIMRWLGVNGGEKCGGGWFDPYGTSPATYVEQARQTILGGAREALLFCYGDLIGGNGPANIEAFRAELPELFQLAALVKDQPIEGIHAPRPISSDPIGDAYFYDFAGMLGLPLVPSEILDPQAQSALLGAQVLKDPQAAEKIAALKKANTPVLITQTLFNQLPDELKADAASFQLLPTAEDKWWDWMKIENLDTIRNTVLAPHGVQFTAPSRVALYLFAGTLTGIENFNDQPVTVTLKRDGAVNWQTVLTLKKENTVTCQTTDGVGTLIIPARTLVLLQSK